MVEFNVTACARAASAGAAMLCALSAGVAAADEARVSEAYAAHAQLTAFVQGYPAFGAPYNGPNSLPGGGQVRQTTSLTGFFSLRMPWDGGEVHFNPEYMQGFGLQNTLGLAGFSNGDAQKGGSETGVLYVARLYVRQTFALGEEREWQPSGPNQLAGYVPTKRASIIVGKFAAVDFFQSSAYAGDARRQFTNWSMWAPGAWDIPADTRGYTQGVVIEIVPSSTFALRYGAMFMPSTPNGPDLPIRPDNIGHVIEAAFQHTLTGRPGTIKPFLFATNGAMGRYRDALSLAAGLAITPDAAMAQTRGFGSFKWGFGVLIDQELSDHVGLFARGSWSDGTTESYAFTQIDRSLAVGLSFKGALWNLPGHTAGIGYARNELSEAHRAYLAAGGTGIIIGDGRLTYAPEHIVEAYYDMPLWRDNVFLAANYQLVFNPAYNAERAGPVHLFGARLHMRY